MAAWLHASPPACHPELNVRRFSAWIAETHDQVEREELAYIAYELDVLAQAL
jgi:hypothetical protein